MLRPSSISELPNVPAVYAMCGGRNRGLHTAYVGLADALRRRVFQHLVKRDSSVSTGTSAASLNPDYVTQVLWWEHPSFTERHVLEAAELIAFDVLNPALRSRGGIQEKAKQLSQDLEFRNRMRPLFSGEPHGLLVLPTLQDALERIVALEERVVELERTLQTGRSRGGDQA
jgi:hypothetical protein